MKDRFPDTQAEARQLLAPAIRHAAMQTKIVFAVLCVATALRAQVPALQQSSVRGVVDDFCQFDADGKRLIAPGAKEFSRTLLLSEAQWEQPAGMVIVADCSVRPVATQKNTAEYAADYHALGRIDSSLFLTRMQVPYSSRPPVQSERFSLVLTDTHTEIGLGGRPTEVKGPVEWRIKSYPSQPHISLNAAIDYVRKMGYGARDIRSRMNAEKTLAELQEMLAGSVTPPEFAEPKAIVSQFIEMQMGGLTLQPETTGQLSTFLIHPESQQGSKIGVARAYAVKNSTFAGKNAIVSVECESLGTIDPQLRFTSAGERGTIVQRDYKLLLDNKYSALGYGDKPATEIVGPSRWRIDETPPEQWVSVSTAIKYLTQMRDSTRELSIKANAEKTLAILSQYR
jgi:hypothetical protein